MEDNIVWVRYFWSKWNNILKILINNFINDRYQMIYKYQLKTIKIIDILSHPLPAINII